MSLLGVHLTLWIGPTVPKPASLDLLEALESVEITHPDKGQSGFQMTFQAGRSGSDFLDYPALLGTEVRPFSRVILMVTFDAVPQVLMDGIITNQQLAPRDEPGSSTLTVTGEDVSVMMDLEEKSAEHPSQDETAIATKLVLSYAQYGLAAEVVPPPTLDVPLPIERTLVQQATDLAYLREMADRYAYVFYVTPGPLPLANLAYWGPPKRSAMPQKALSVNMGPDSNVALISFQYDAMAAATIASSVQDRTTNQTLPVETFASTRIPLVSQPALIANFANTRKRLLSNRSGLNHAQAFARAQASTDQTSESAVTASGELDTARYGNILSPRSLVDLRGAGYTYDGTYYVQSVTHSIRKGEYKQRFSLAREGVGALSPVVQT